MESCLGHLPLYVVLLAFVVCATIVDDLPTPNTLLSTLYKLHRPFCELRAVMEVVLNGHDSSSTSMKWLLVQSLQ